MMSNYHLKDRNLSIKAKGLLSIMLSLPEDWDYSIQGLVRISKDGKDSVMSTLNELKAMCYVKMSQAKTSSGQFAAWEYDVYEVPYNINLCGESDSGRPNAENPNTENPTQLNTNNIDSRIINNTPTNKNIKEQITKINTPPTPQGEVCEWSAEEEEFELFRRAYKGSKRGHDIEFKDFCKHKDWKDVVKFLIPAYSKQESIREEQLRKTGWRPQRKNLKTYLNQRCWEEEVTYDSNQTTNTKANNQQNDTLRRISDWAHSDANPFRNL